MQKEQFNKALQITLNKCTLPLSKFKNNEKLAILKIFWRNLNLNRIHYSYVRNQQKRIGFKISRQGNI